MRLNLFSRRILNDDDGPPDLHFPLLDFAGARAAGGRTQRAHPAVDGGLYHSHGDLARSRGVDAEMKTTKEFWPPSGMPAVGYLPWRTVIDVSTIIVIDAENVVMFKATPGDAIDYKQLRGFLDLAIERLCDTFDTVND